MRARVARAKGGEVFISGAVKDIVSEIAPHSEVYLRTLAEPDRAERVLVEQPHVGPVRRDRQGLIFDFEGSPEDRAILLANLVDTGIQPVEFSTKETDLEDVFLKLTEGKVQ